MKYVATCRVSQKFFKAFKQRDWSKDIGFALFLPDGNVTISGVSGVVENGTDDFVLSLALDVYNQEIMPVYTPDSFIESLGFVQKSKFEYEKTSKPLTDEIETKLGNTQDELLSEIGDAVQELPATDSDEQVKDEENHD